MRPDSPPPSISDVLRFVSKLDMSGPAHPELGSPCWLWLGARDHARRGEAPSARGNGRGGRLGGYGTFSLAGRTQAAHRVAYAIAYGPPVGIVLHQCDTPTCCNPQHMRNGSHSSNLRDAYERGRRVRKLKRTIFAATLGQA